METIINIQGLKPSKNPKCTVYETDQGIMSAWDALCTELNKHIGKPIKVDVVVDGKWKNIKAFLGEAVEEQTVKATHNVIQDYVDAVLKLKKEEIPVQAQATNNPNNLAEKDIRMNISTNVKGHASYDVTIRANTQAEANKLLDEAVAKALSKCAELNQGEKPPEQEVVA